MLKQRHRERLIRDTALFSGSRKYAAGSKPALRLLAQEVLGIDIQKGAHSSIEDARVAMLLFRRHKPAFDNEHAARFPDPAPTRRQKPDKKTAKPKGKKKKKKKRKN